MIVKLPVKDSEYLKFYLGSFNITNTTTMLFDPISKECWLAEQWSDVKSAFFFLGDLCVIETASYNAILATYDYYMKSVLSKRVYPTAKFLLVCHELKVFDAFSCKEYPMAKYGKQIPRGMDKIKFKNREQRDLEIEPLLQEGYICIFDKDLHDNLMEVSE